MRLPVFIRVLARKNRREITFVAKFVLFYAIGQAAYLSLLPILTPFLTEKCTAAVSAVLISYLIPGEHAVATGPLISGSVSLKIALGCDGMEGLILVIAAICAFPGSLLRRCAGAAIGTAVIYIANLIRVVGLYYTLKSHPDAFSFAHMYAGQAYIVFVAFLFFLAWVGRSTVHHEEAH